jgi:D-tyrosyl-tRNA(Tyr) deacylase
MKAVIQRVRCAQVEVDGRVMGACSGGFLVLLGVVREDTREDAQILAKKIVQLRVFEDEEDKMNLSLLNTGGGLLVVSNFTLAADCTGGRRPSFFGAMPPQQAQELYEDFVACCRAEGVETQTGVFGAHMHIIQHDDGPVTILLDSNELKRKKS